MCVHAAHVACQPAWQPGGLPSTSSSSLASKSEVPFLSSPSLSFSSSALSIPSTLFFPFFPRKSSATGEEGGEKYLPFYQTAASYLEHSHPRPHLRLERASQQVSDYREHFLRRGLKAFIARWDFPDGTSTSGRIDERTIFGPRVIKIIILLRSAFYFSLSCFLYYNKYAEIRQFPTVFRCILTYVLLLFRDP